MIKSKAENTIRFSGLFLITTAIPLTIVSDIIQIEYILFLLIYIFSVIPWLCFYVAWKLTVNGVIERSQNIQIALLGYSIILFLLPVSFIKIHFSRMDYLAWVFQILKVLSLLVCWNFSISIFKKRKVLFLFFGGLYCVLMVLFLLLSLELRVLSLLSLTLTIIGMCCISLSEYMMFRKGDLKYL